MMPQTRKAQERQAAKICDAMTKQAAQDAARIAELEAANADLTKQLQHATLVYHVRVAERDAAYAELAEAERRIASQNTYAADMRRTLATLTEKHTKLSDIVRLALTPEQYHQYRRIVENN